MNFWGLIFSLVAMVGTGFGEPLVKGLQGNHPLSDYQQGKVLVEELRCAACHEGIGGEMKVAPDLSEVGSRVRGDYLGKYLADPHGTHAGTTMPDVLAGLAADEKKEVSESIAHYLRSLTAAKKEKPVAGDGKFGREVYHEVGCVACHGAGDDSGVESLLHVRKKYQKGELAAFLADPLKVRKSGRMPDLKMSAAESLALEAYLGDSGMEKMEKPAADQVALGKENFEKHNCASCHDLGGAKSQMGPKLAELDLEKGCFVDYQLSEQQAGQIKLALEEPVVLSKQERVKVHLTKLNCIACHQRDDFGGVAEDLEGFFHTSEEGLGNEARIPPPLTKIGGKLKSEWMNKVLYDGLSVRPYMKTRMPQYGRGALEGLPELLAEVDELPTVELAEPNREERPMVSNGGHLLLGTKGLNCIACHNYNGKESPGMKGLDLITTYQRLQPGWFYEFMKNPGRHRPGIVMPSYWPDGKAVQPDILGGDMHEQLRALWYQFSLGRSARDPAGLRSKPNELIVGDKVRVYRGRSRVAGFRGIAVGFPGGMNYSFNAENGALTGIWKGRFITANWRSQGAGDFNPAERIVALAQDVAFVQLKDRNEKWPLRPVMTKEAPVNPDPLYPKNHGYAFQGYSLDKTGNPTLKYRCGEILIEDRTAVLGEKSLRRTFEFTSKKDEVVYFRVLSGEVTEKSDAVFESAGLKVGFPVGVALVREVSEGKKEVLVEMKVSKGKTTYTIDYELVR